MGVSQFPKLKFLDISHNFIKELNEFLFLKDLKNLEVLICEGNPINKSPVFEDTIIAIVGGLKTFNNKVILTVFCLFFHVFRHFCHFLVIFRSFLTFFIFLAKNDLFLMKFNKNIECFY